MINRNSNRFCIAFAIFISKSIWESLKPLSQLFSTKKKYQTNHNFKFLPMVSFIHCSHNSLFMRNENLEYPFLYTCKMCTGFKCKDSFKAHEYYWFSANVRRPKCLPIHTTTMTTTIAPRFRCLRDFIFSCVTLFVCTRVYTTTPTACDMCMHGQCTVDIVFARQHFLVHHRKKKTAENFCADDMSGLVARVNSFIEIMKFIFVLRRNVQRNAE